MKKIVIKKYHGLLALSALLLVGCSAGSNSMENQSTRFLENSFLPMATSNNNATWPEFNSPSGLPHEEPLVYYGELTPTLYTSMPEEQRDSIVALWDIPDSFAFCSATIISPHVVLTAAHCVIHQSEENNNGEVSIETWVRAPQNVEVRIGKNNQSPDKRLPVKEIHYLDHIKSGYQNDLAIVILEEPDYTTTKIDIQSGSIQAAFGQQVQVVGYGKTEHKGDSYIGYVNSLRRWTTVDCLGYGYSSQILIYGHGKTGIGSGDSGSPLLFDFGDGIRIIGVASNGNVSGVGDAYYTSVEQHEKWIRSFINKYDNLACEETCSKVECGLVGECSCGSCERGMECNATHQCVQKDSGRGGICLAYYPEGTECRRDSDCADGQYCLAIGLGTACVSIAHCQTVRCSKVDPASICRPVWIDEPTNFAFCMESSITLCDQNSSDGTCITSDGSIGNCLSNNGCYKGCRNVDTCGEKEFCQPFDCAAFCANRECGEVAGCECGKCADDEVCDKFICSAPGEPEAKCACNVDANCNADCACDPDCRDNDSSAKKKSKGCNGGGSASALALLALLWALKRRKDLAC